MNRIDKLLYLVKTNTKHKYTLICMLIPEVDHGYSLRLNLQKDSKLIDSIKEHFSNLEQCDNFITDYCAQYQLTDHNTLKLFFNITPANNEVL